MGGEKSIVGMEVPYFSSDSINWVEASVPDATNSNSNSNSNCKSSPPVARRTENYASYSVIGSPPTYLIWRISKRLPHAIEILEVCADKESPGVALRILFSEKDSVNGNMYLLYVLSVTGTAYLFQLKTIAAYSYSFVFSSNEFTHLDTKSSLDCPPITAATATAGCLVIGREDGSISCFHLGARDKDAPDFMHYIRNAPAFSFLWRLMSRSRLSSFVKDLVISELNGRMVLLGLDSDGSLLVWDLFSRAMLLYDRLSVPGYFATRLWVAPVHARGIRFAVLLNETTGVAVYTLEFPPGECCRIFLECSISQPIPLFEGKVIDVKLSFDKIWILKEDILIKWDLSFGGEEQRYSLQEAFIAEQLFLSSKHSSDHLYQTTCSLFSSSKAQIIEFISSLFLRRLMHPAVHNSSVFRLTLKSYDKHWIDHGWQTLTVDGLRRQILLFIKQEATRGSPYSAFKCWKIFCSRYFDQWCKVNEPFGLLVELHSGAVGLIRQNGVSQFRSLEDIELLTHGTSEKLPDFPMLGFDASTDQLECEILFEVLHCTRRFNQRLGPTISPIFYESVVAEPVISPVDIMPRLLKTVKFRYYTAVTALHVSEVGADFIWRKELADHKSLRRFLIDTLVYIHALRKKASGWGRVLNVIGKYLNVLVPRKPTEKLDSDLVFHANISFIVQATSQVAGVMFQSALSILLFLSYLLDNVGQVHMQHDDVSKIQLELVPMIHEIIAGWLIIYFFGTMPSESLSGEEISSQLSSIRDDSNTGRRSWTQRLGSIDVTLALILLLDAEDSCEGWSSLSLSSLPNPRSINNLVRHFSSWITWGSSGEKPLHVFWRSAELALSLLRHSQYNSVESLLKIADAYLRSEKLSGSIQSSAGEWCVLHHLLGCCLLTQARSGLSGPPKGKLSKAMRCFFRAASRQGAADALQKLPYEEGLPPLNKPGCVSTAAWKLHYYQWVMQKFVQCNISDAACQFALAALEQADEVVLPNGDASLTEAISIKGKIWAKIFKFALDLDQYYNAYCAIASNPDEETKYICLKRFIVVLNECCATKILCYSHLRLIGLNDKVEQELALMVPQYLQTLPLDQILSSNKLREGILEGSKYFHQNE